MQIGREEAGEERKSCSEKKKKTTNSPVWTDVYTRVLSLNFNFTIQTKTFHTKEVEHSCPLDCKQLGKN